MILPIRLRKSILLLSDLALMYLSLVLALFLRRFEFPEPSELVAHLGPFTLVFVVWSATFYVSGLYSLKRFRDLTRELPALLRTFSVAAMFAVVLFYLAKDFYITPKTVLVLFTICYLVLFVSWRSLYFRFILQESRKLRVALAGWDPAILDLLPRTQALEVAGYQISLLYHEDPDGPNELPGVNLTRQLSTLTEAVEGGKIDLIVLATDPHFSENLSQFLFLNLSRTLSYVSLPEFYETATNRVPINSINRFWFLEHLNLRAKVPYERFKRAIDLVASLVALLVTLPVWPLLWLLIRLESRGPALFRQVRAGRHGRPFTILKFRTMRVEGNDSTMTIAGDSRITRLGKFLRASRLDELPQLLNILRGEMSFVGPRPERPEFVAQLEKSIPFYRQRMLVMPGLTGWDQVSGEYHSASEEDSLKKLQYDLYYVKNRGLMLDFSITLKTIATVFSRVGR